MIVYKIQRMSDGLYSTGGSYPRFSKKGKIWKQRGHVSSHLTLFSESEKKKIYGDCKVVGFEVVEEEIGSIDVSDWTLAKSTIRAKELQEQRQLEYQKEQKLQEIKRLEEKLKKLKS